MNKFSLTKQILTPQFIRKSCEDIYKYSLGGQTYFIIHEDKIPACADYVLDVIYENYPNLDIPFHSRWGHFNVGIKENPKINRLQKLNEFLNSMSPLEKAKAKWDFVIPSVLLDAGAGMQWKYFDKEHNATFSKSEGLALASLDLFYDGFFNNADTLLKIVTHVIGTYFQVSSENPLVGLEGRVQLMRNLGHMIKNNPTLFKNEKLSDLMDEILKKNAKQVSAPDVLTEILIHLSDIWPSRLKLDNINLGDVWIYPPLSHQNLFYVAFHKLSQWLTYSLLEPLQEMGVDVVDVEKLTGLCEYRNGGLFYDFGVLELKEKRLSEYEHKPDSELILEWRALTICLLDKIGKLIQNKLQKSEKEFPLAKVLEGGTWWAGRKIAKSKRSDGGPPFLLKSDGTVF